MLISKKKINKIIGFSFLFLILFSVFLPFSKIQAVEQSIALERVACNLNGTTNKWSWGFKITTVGLPDGTNIYDYLFQGATAMPPNQTSPVKSNYAEYLTGSILDPNTNYTVRITVAGTPNLSASYTEKTPLDGVKTCAPAQPPVVITNNSSTPVDTDTTYTLLAPLPFMGLDGTSPTFDTDPHCTTDANGVKTCASCPFGKYLNIMIKLFFGIAGVLAVVMIVMGGIQYMTSELISSKEEGKKSITNAVFGLLLALGAWLILNTINPDLLNVCLNNLPIAEITISPETHEGTIGIEGKTTTVNGQILTACKPEEMTSATLFGKQIPGGINKAVVADITAINTAWENCQNSTASNCSAIKNYEINTVGGGYDCRSVRGQPTKTSAHAFGIAIDINASTNPFEPGATTCTTDMPPEFVKLFKDQGWGWGGNWPTVKDAMHFSKLSTETRFNNPCGSSLGGEVYNNVEFVLSNKSVMLTINNYDATKAHNVKIYYPGWTVFKSVPDTNGSTQMAGSKGLVFVGLTSGPTSTKEYETLKGKTVKVAIWSASVGLDTKDLLIP